MIIYGDVDEDYILKDGQTLRVPQQFMDHGGVVLVRDTFGQPAGQRPGAVYAVLRTDADEALDAAYAEYNQRLTTAWQQQPPRVEEPPEQQQDAAVDAREQAYRDHETFLQNAWRSR